MNVVYFIQSGVDGPIKVGTTATPARRLETLQRGNPVPLTIMATTPGGYELEREFHSLFARGALGSEWFRRDTPGLIETVHHILRYGELPARPESSPDGAACLTCHWPAEVELAERGIAQCWRCLSDAAGNRSRRSPGSDEERASK